MVRVELIKNETRVHSVMIFSICRLIIRAYEQQPREDRIGLACITEQSEERSRVHQTFLSAQYRVPCERCRRIIVNKKYIMDTTWALEILARA